MKHKSKIKQQSQRIRKSSATGLMSLALMGLSLSGCVSLLLGVDQGPPRFTLEPVDYVQTAEQFKVRLVIADPTTEAAFDTSRIALSPSPLRYEYYANAEWADRAPDLFRIFMERSFENNGRIETVGDKASLPLGDYTLQTDIRDFHIEVRDGLNVARISYFVRLLDAKNRNVATQLFTANEPIQDGQLVTSIEAFNRAANRTGDATVNWTLKQLETEEAGR